MTQFTEQEKAAVYRVMRERRDMRHFLPDPVDPVILARLLALPTGARPVAILCLGHVEACYPVPMLEQEDWRQRRPWHEFVFHDTWGNPETRS